MAYSVAGSQFDILDKAVAARGLELYAKPWIYRQDYDEWMTQYNQLRSFALSNSGDSYVSRQWKAEEPRYANAPALLASKIRVADPANYDTSMSVSGGGCGCGSKLTPFQSSPIDYRPFGGDGGMLQRGAIPTNTNSFFFGPLGSAGDAARNLFSPSQIPFFAPPSAIKKLAEDVGHDTLTGILVALIVGGVLWGVHYLTKKKRNA